MDKVTSKVRAFYETYPYPPGGAVDTDGYHARLLLSYIERPENATGKLQVLEAGSGRALNLLAAARLQPDVAFTGIDINRVAIREAQQKAVALGLENLQFAEGDLLNPASIPTVPGGYDLILSYGVIHHLSDPQAGLAHLRGRLAAHGAVGMMVDGSYGRQPLDRFRDALAFLERDDESVSSRDTARALSKIAEQTLFKGNYWQGTSSSDDVEFADRCLHVHENSYDIESINRLLADSGLRFIRWLEPADWSVTQFGEESLLQSLLSKLDAHQRYRLVERLFYRPKLIFMAAAMENSIRCPLRPESWEQVRFRINPQVRFFEREERLCRYQLRNREPVEIHSLCATQILSLRDLSQSDMTATQITDDLSRQGQNRESVYQSLLDLETAELIYRPNTLPGGEAG
ncbi:MAG: class I SAM-dependent methyltransferase [Candidatus Thiodiazotropha sp. (ex Monitilora ramsayi)]|nr:class I SAM-dependent methyltransferase [Candidatus Thiodiazotropha sp. (ex Monitilora ramsayi)]